MNNRQRQPRYRLTFEDAIDVHRRLRLGEYVDRIVAHFDGRVSEVKNGTLHPGSREAALGEAGGQPRLI